MGDSKPFDEVHPLSVTGSRGASPARSWALRTTLGVTSDLGPPRNGLFRADWHHFSMRLNSRHICHLL